MVQLNLTYKHTNEMYMYFYSFLLIIWSVGTDIQIYIYICQLYNVHWVVLVTRDEQMMGKGLQVVGG